MAANTQEVPLNTNNQQSKAISISKTHWLYVHCHARSAGYVEDSVMKRDHKEHWLQLEDSATKLQFHITVLSQWFRSFLKSMVGGLVVWWRTLHGEKICWEWWKLSWILKENQAMTQANQYWDRLEEVKVLNCLWKTMLKARKITEVIFKVYMEFLKEERNMTLHCHVAISKNNSLLRQEQHPAPEAKSACIWFMGHLEGRYCTMTGVENFKMSVVDSAEVSPGAAWAWRLKQNSEAKIPSSYSKSWVLPVCSWNVLVLSLLSLSESESVTYSVAGAEGLCNTWCTEQEGGHWKLLFVCFQCISPDTPAKN